jgi:hypothetical protein
VKLFVNYGVAGLEVIDEVGAGEEQAGEVGPCGSKLQQLTGAQVVGPTKLEQRRQKGHTQRERERRSERRCFKDRMCLPLQESVYKCM